MDTAGASPCPTDKILYIIKHFACIDNIIAHNSPLKEEILTLSKRVKISSINT